MYFWNTRQLALDLREGKVTERQQMWYLFAFVVFATVGMYVVSWVPIDVTASMILAGVADVVVTIYGLLECYQVNNRGDGKDFVVRFICMSWPVGWRVLACFLVLSLVFSFILGIVASTYADPLLNVLGVGVTVAYFGLIRKWLIEISSAEISGETNT